MVATRLHSKVLIVWNRWLAVQVVTTCELAVGVAFHWRRPMLDIYLGPVTIAVGRTAAVTDMHERLRSRCRGFFIGGYPEEAVL